MEDALVVRQFEAGMRPRRRLACFALLLAAVFGGSVAVGRVVPDMHDDDIGRSPVVSLHQGAE